MKLFDAGKTRMIGLPYGDRFAISMSRVSMLTRDKNGRCDTERV